MTAGPTDHSLPYRDEKPVGAADFYFVINASFRFIEAKFGPKGLREYWADLGRRYYSPVTASWKRGGLPAVASYWKSFFAAEPGADVTIALQEHAVVLEVRTCPALAHLKKHGRPILPCFCQHCFFVSDAMGEGAGITARVEGGNGSCRQRFMKTAANPAPQDLRAIKEAQ